MIRLSRFAANSIHRKSKISTTNFESSTKQHKKPTANINEVYAKIQQIKHDESVKNKRWGNEKSKVSDHGPSGFQLADKREGKTDSGRVRSAENQKSRRKSRKAQVDGEWNRPTKWRAYFGNQQYSRFA